MYTLPHSLVYRNPTHTDQYLAYDSHHPQSVKRGIVKCLYDRANDHQLSLKKRHIYHRYFFRTDILLHLYEGSQRQQHQQPTKKLRRNLNLLQFYPTRQDKKNTMEIYGLLVRKPPQLQSTLTKRGIFLFGKKLFISLLIVTPHWYTSRVKEAIHIRLHPNNINRDSGIESPEAWNSRNVAINNSKRFLCETN